MQHYYPVPDNRFLAEFVTPVQTCGKICSPGSAGKSGSADPVARLFTVDIDRLPGGRGTMFCVCESNVPPERSFAFAKSVLTHIQPDRLVAETSLSVCSPSSFSTSLVTYLLVLPYSHLSGESAAHLQVDDGS